MILQSLYIVYLFRLIHDIQSLFVILNNLSYIHHFVDDDVEIGYVLYVGVL